MRVPRRPPAHPFIRSFLRRIAARVPAGPRRPPWHGTFGLRAETTAPQYLLGRRTLPANGRLTADENLNRRAGTRGAVDRRLLAGASRRTGGSAVVRARLRATAARDTGLARGTWDAVVAGNAAVCVAVAAATRAAPTAATRAGCARAAAGLDPMAGLGGTVSTAPLLKASGGAAGRALGRAHVDRRDIGWARCIYGLELAGAADVRAASATAAMTARAPAGASSSTAAVPARIPALTNSPTTAVASCVPAGTSAGAAAVATTSIASTGYRSATRAHTEPKGRDRENESCSHGV